MTNAAKKKGWCSGHLLRLPSLSSARGLRFVNLDQGIFSPGTLVVLSLQIQLSGQDVSRQAIKH